MKPFLLQHKYWIFIIIAFILVRVLMFSTFWEASVDQGGWQHFYGYAQPAPGVLSANFHETCDWHPPFYYAFVPLILFLFGSQLFIYAIHLLLAFLSLVLVYKIARLFFSEKTALIAVFLMAIEPFWAWHNFLLVSENLYIPVVLASFYFFFKGFLRFGQLRDVIYSALFFGLATLVRLNSLLLPAFLSFILILLFILKGKLRLTDYLPALSFKRFLLYIFIFNVVFLAVLAPWVIRNKIVYDRFTVANIISTNFYFYNLPALISLQKNISRAEAADLLIKKADRDLGRNIVAEKWNCNVFTNGEFKQHLNYYKTEASKYIFSNLSDYLPMYFIKAFPFFLQSGYFDIYSAYTGEYSKPNMTNLILSGDYAAMKEFITEINLKLIIYLGGIIFWGITSLLVIIGLFYSYFRDKKRFAFMLFAASIILYSAFLSSPSVSVRHRLSITIFFFVPLAYIIIKLLDVWRNRNKDLDDANNNN